MNTAEKLIAAAGSLLDSGGQGAVTLRAVAQEVGVSHNAPYKHFVDRNALLAAVAERDFIMLTAELVTIAKSRRAAKTKLMAALTFLVSYGRSAPARYRLLFSDPDVGQAGGTLEATALQSFAAFAAIVEECQREKELPSGDIAPMTSLIIAQAHGLIDLEAGGRTREAKGLTNALDGVVFFLKQLAKAQGR